MSALFTSKIGSGYFAMYISATGENGLVPSPLTALTSAGALPGLVISVFPTGTAMPGPSPATTELIVTPNTGGVSLALGVASLGGGGAGGGVGASTAGRFTASRGLSGGGGGGSGGGGLTSGGGSFSSMSISIGASA